jgi:hypothetical protein
MPMMTGLYRFKLLPGAEPEAFERHMQSVVFNNLQVLQLTRVTRAFTHQLLQGPMQQYVWQVTVDLVADDYDFDQNADRVRDSVKEFATLIGIESYNNLGPPHCRRSADGRGR